MLTPPSPPPYSQPLQDFSSICKPNSSQSLVPSNHPLQNSQLDPTRLGCQPPNCCIPPHLLPSKINFTNILLTTKGPVYLGAFNVVKLDNRPPWPKPSFPYMSMYAVFLKRAYKTPLRSYCSDLHNRTKLSHTSRVRRSCKNRSWNIWSEDRPQSQS